MQTDTMTKTDELLADRESVTRDGPATAEATATEVDAASGSEPGSDARASTPLTKDVLFELLKNERRRNALAFLKAEAGATTLSDMAEHIAAIENDTTVAQLTSSQRKRVYIGLYQCHLPKMDAAGVVAFDKNRGTIRLLEAAAQLDQFLAPTGSESGSEPGAGADSDSGAAVASPPARGFLAAAVAIGAGTAATLLGLPVFAAVPEAGWAIVSATALAAFAGLEIARDRP